jgi:CBS domain containing-hemolysin-like protein
MSDTIIVAIIAFMGTLIGSVASVFASSNLTKYRIEDLTEQVKKHNEVIERTYKLEQHAAVIDEQIKVVNHRIQDLEEIHHGKD